MLLGILIKVKANLGDKTRKKWNWVNLNFSFYHNDFKENISSREYFNKYEIL